MSVPNRHYVFVYGSLLSGMPNDYCLATAEFLGTATVAAGQFTMLDLGAFPALVLDPQGEAVPGELYKVDAATLARLDRLEGHPRFYRRRPVSVQCGGQRLRAVVYVLNDAQIGRPPVPDNDWRRHRDQDAPSRARRS